MFLNIPIEVLFMLAGNDVPSFGLSKMVVVDGVDEEVLDMPTKGGELHAEVHPWLSNPANFVLLFLDYLEEGGRRLVDVVQIE